jgi:anti-sigma factor RsiW
MDCTQARTLLLDGRRGTLPADSHAQLSEHLAQCDACRREDAADRQLSTLLDSRLPQPTAPAALRRAVKERWRGRHGWPQVRARGLGRMLATMAAGAALAVLAILGWRAQSSNDGMVAEAVNDHLRIVTSERPFEVESSDRHVVKPWFIGRLDFAPELRFDGDQEFPLQGGAVAYFIDRKAAAFIFGRRLHRMTLFVFRADGLPWPAVGTTAIGSVRGTMRTSRGFHVLLWRSGDLGYGIVSDVDENDVRALANRIAGPPPG